MMADTDLSLAKQKHNFQMTVWLRWHARARVTAPFRLFRIITVVLTPNCDYCHLLNWALHNAHKIWAPDRQKLISMIRYGPLHSREKYNFALLVGLRR